MSKSVRVGVVGVGSLGFHHARILAELPEIELAGVYDVDAGTRRRVSQQIGARDAASLDELLEWSDAVIIAVPTTGHSAVALEAVRRGVHVLIEKPIATTVEEADEVLDRARSAGVLVGTGHVERFNAALRACEPYLNGPRFIESHRLAPFNPRGTDVAVVLDLMIHDIDLVLGLADADVVDVDSVGVPILTPSVDIANARLRFANGAVANITASRVSRERLRKIRIFQPSGYLSLDLATGTGEFLRLRPDVVLGGALQDGSATLQDIVERVEFQGDGQEPLRAELEAFVAAVRGERPLVVTGEDGRRALTVALGIVKRIEGDLAAWK